MIWSLSWIDVLVMGIVFVASLTQSLSGFGFGLVAVPLLQQVIGIVPTASLVTLVSLIIVISLIIYYRQALQLQAVARLAVTSIVMIPLGVYLSAHLNDCLFKAGLGILLVGYSSYSLCDLKLPQLTSTLWSYWAGACSGLLTGLANVGGPPLIIYGQCQKWSPETFKCNLQGLFLTNICLVFLSRLWQGSLTPEIWRWFVLCLPMLGFSLSLGIWLGKGIHPVQFRRLIWSGLIAIGILLQVQALLCFR